jgi:hypothetical protein
MRRRLASLGVGLGLVGALAAGAPARAQLYRWVDASDRLHVTDDLGQVPPEIRSEVEAGTKRSAPAEAAAPPAAPAPAPLGAPTSRGAPGPGGPGAPAPAPRTAAPAQANPAPILRAVTPADLAKDPEPVAPAPPRPRRHSISVERGGLEIAVTALLEGQVRAPFKVDTGATINTIPRAVVEELGIQIDEGTPLIAVSGISGQAQLVPVVVLREVRLGDAAVEHVEAAVLDTLEYGLLGMPFFNHFRVEMDPSAGRLVLEELPAGAIEGLYGGYPEDYWRGRFRMVRAQLDQIAAARDRLPEHFGEFHDRLDTAEGYWEQQELELEDRASRAGVPRAWRE